MNIETEALIRRIEIIPDEQDRCLEVYGGVPELKELVERYLRNSTISVDVFARNNDAFTFTNDINPTTAAEYHLEAYEFLCLMKKNNVSADLVFFDPPHDLYESVYSNAEAKCWWEHHNKIMLKEWGRERDILADWLHSGSVVISSGLSSFGLGRKRGFTPIEIVYFSISNKEIEACYVVEKKI
jgi:hypothetical protein